ncbi:MAG: efflux RND transporter periplasmic adaptor subunit [Candidatus Hydrogenedentota bacterium]
MQDSKKLTSGLIYIVILIVIVGFTWYTVSNYIKFKHKKVEIIEEIDIIPVEVVKAEYQRLNQVLELTGDLIPYEVVDIYPRVPNKIIKDILIEKGERVCQGDTIAILEDETVRTSLNEARATLCSAKARMKEIEAKLESIQKDKLRFENLFKNKAISRQKLDHIEAEYKAAMAAKELAESEINRAGLALNQVEILDRYHRIYAPISGIVSERFIDKGSLSNIAQPVVRINNEEKLKVITGVSERYFPYLKKEMKAEIIPDAFNLEKGINGEISIISPTIDPATRTGKIEIIILNKNFRLCSGMFVHINLFLGEKSALVIPVEALNKMPGTGTYYIYTVIENKAFLRNIETGIQEENLIEVREGINRGDVVIIKGQNRIRQDGTRVQIVKGL